MTQRLPAETNTLDYQGEQPPIERSTDPERAIRTSLWLISGSIMSVAGALLYGMGVIVSEPGGRGRDAVICGTIVLLVAAGMLAMGIFQWFKR